MAAVQGEAAGVKEKRPRDPDKGSAVPEPEERDSADSEVSVLTVRRVAAKKHKRAQRWFCCELVTMEGL